MPYAQKHYPFSFSQEQFEAQFPADFIAEGLDQTRGWFYTLLVLSTALFDKPPFQNLIVNGLVLAEDGKKMSKRLKNYPEPELVMNEIGADALRLYLVTSPVVRAEPLRFSQPGVKEVLKAVFLPWQNAYRFFVQNARRWQLENGKRFVATGSGYVASTNVMDRWVQAALSSLVQFVRTEMEGYRLYSVTPKLLGFIEALTNWYVRMNRKRLKGGDGEADAAIALGTLFEVLLAMCGLMAPFCPFLTEAMYQNLKACLPAGDLKQDSLHYVAMPKASTEAHDPRIVQQVERMQDVIELARQARDKRKLSVKTPLPSITVVHRSAEVAADVQALRSYIMEEVNVREVVTSNDDSLFSLSAVTDDRTLGKRLGQAFKAVKQAVPKLTNEQLRQYQVDGQLEIEGQLLSGDDLRIQLNFRGDTEAFEAASNAQGDLVVLVDLRVNDTLRDEGIAREVVNRIQKLRKKAQLSLEDKIRVTYQSAHATLAPLLAAQAAYIAEAIGSEFVDANAAQNTGEVVGDPEEETIQEMKVPRAHVRAHVSVR
jgi:isoleucyl-tRNA synthetase